MTKSKLVDRVLGRAPEVLPDDLNQLSPRQVQHALDERESRLATLVKNGPRARGEQRRAMLEAVRVTVSDVKRLQRAVEFAGLSPSERVLAMQVGAGARADHKPRQRTRAQRALAALRDQWSLPNELAGTVLHAGNLSDEEGDELYGLLELRHLPNAPGWGEEQRLRFEALVEKAAGWPCFQELHAGRDIERLVEEVRRDGLPKRVEYAEIGSVRLPGSVFDALRSSQGRSWVVGDVASLAVLLHCFEIRDASLVERATFEEDEAGESVLVGKGQLKFISRVNTSAADSFGGSRVELDLDWLARVGWFDVTREGGRIEVRLGPNAKALRKGES